MRISVAVTTYNGCKYIVEQLESIRLQTHQPDEVVIVDDCSKDNTKKIVTNYIRQHHLENWSFLSNKMNVGWKKNTIIALTRTQGDYVFYSDQDDIWPNDKIERMYSVIKNQPKCLLLASDFINFEAGKKIVIKEDTGKVTPRYFDYKWFYIKKPGAAFAIHRDIIEKLKYFYDDELATDLLLWHLAMIEDGLYIYSYCGVFRRCHGKNVTNENTHQYKIRLEYVEESITYLKRIKEYYLKNYGYQDTYEYRARLICNTLKFKNKQVNLFNKPSIGRWLSLLPYISYYGKMQSWITDGRVLLSRNKGRQMRGSR